MTDKFDLFRVLENHVKFAAENSKYSESEIIETLITEFAGIEKELKERLEVK